MLNLQLTEYIMRTERVANSICMRYTKKQTVFYYFTSLNVECDRHTKIAGECILMQTVITCCEMTRTVACLSEFLRIFKTNL